MFVVPFDVHFHYIDNAFMCMRVTAAQSELSEARISVNERTPWRTNTTTNNAFHHVTFLNLYIDLLSPAPGCSSVCLKNYCDSDSNFSFPITGILRRSFVRWQHRRDEVLIMRLKYGRAVSHDRRARLGRALQGWDCFMRLTLRKQVRLLSPNSGIYIIYIKLRRSCDSSYESLKNK